MSLCDYLVPVCLLYQSSPSMPSLPRTPRGRWSSLVGKTHLSLAFVPLVPSQVDTNAWLALSVLNELALCFLLISLSGSCSKVQSQTLTTNTTEQSFASLTLEFSIFLPLSLMTMAHLDNASVLRRTLSYPALDGTSCNHILSFFLFASCSR